MIFGVYSCKTRELCYTIYTVIFVKTEEIIIKEGLVFENGELLYYKNGEPYHAGVVEENGAVYYISSHGRAVKGEHVVHGVMCNGILKRGTYTFGEDYKLVEDSYHAPRVKKKRRHRTRSKKKKQKWQTMIAAGMLAAAVLVAGVWLAVLHFTNTPPVTDNDGTKQDGSSPDAQIVLPQFDEEVLLCSVYAKQAYDHVISIADAASYGAAYCPFVFEYQLVDMSGVLRLSEDSAMADYREYPLEKEKTSLSIDNLKTGTTYYYQVVVGDDIYTGSFRTARSTRFLYIDGVKNVRDIGGYRTLDGKTVKQGMLIRGAEFDGMVNSGYFLSEKACLEVQETFGFVYDMDLRAPETYAGTYRSRLGEDVGHKFYAAPSYGSIFTPENLESVRNIFKDLADPAKYPLYLHCTWGADRTGTFVFLLQGLLNMSEQDMVQEYQLTGYDTGSDFLDSTKMDVLIWGLEPYEGDTLHEKIISYLTTTVGVTQEEIESIRSILLE